MENITKEQQWVSINDRLPDIKKKVLIYVSSDNDKLTGLHVGHRMPGDNFWIISGKFSFDVGDVTHWTTLPQLPASGSVAASKEEGLNIPWDSDYYESRIKELKEALKELLKFADMYLHSKVLEYARGNFEKSELEESAAIIERARKLLNP